MSIKRINEFPEGSGSLSNDDIFLFMDNPSGAAVTKKISLSQVAAAIGGASLPTTGLTITRTGDWVPWQSPPFFNLVPAQAAQFGGDYVRYSGKWIAGWTGYSEANWATGTRVTSLTFDDLEGVAGVFSPNNMGALTTLSLPALRYVGGSFSPASMGALTTLSVPSLAYVAGGFNPFSLLSLTTVSLPSLTRVEGGFALNNIVTLLNSLSLPSLSAVAGNLSIGSNAITTLSLPALISVGGSLTLNNMANLTTLSLPLLTSVGQSTGIGLSISGNANLTTLSLPSLVSLLALTGISGASLANVTLPTDGRFKVGGSSMSMTGSALTQASVDNVLQAYASLDGTNETTSFTGTINISGGTSAAPSNLGSTTTAGSNFVCSGTTCTVNWTNHGYATNDVLRISGITTATNANRYARITVVNANQFTYTITSQNATGAGTATVIRAGASASALVTRGVTLTTN